MYQKQCETCGTPFETPYKRVKFCSYECIQYEIYCLNCGEKCFKRRPTTRYCSEECKEQHVVIAAEKKCNKCGITKKIDEFQKDKTNPTGKRSYCKECSSNYDRKRRREQKLQSYMKSIGYVETDKTIPAEIDLNSTKPCTICKVDKPLKEFRPVYVNKKFNRFHAHCNVCASTKAKEYKRKSEMKKYREMHEKGKAELERKQKELEEKGEM